MDVALAIDDSQDLTGLRQVRRQRVIGLVLGMVRVEAPLGSFREKARAQHRAIEIERDAREFRLSRRVVRQASKQLAQPFAHGEGRLLQRARHRAIAWQLLQAGKAQEDRIALQHPQVPQPGASEQEHADQRQRDAERSVVAVELADREHLSEPLREARAIDEAPKQLEPTVRAQLLVGELDGKIGLDTASNQAFPYSHERGLSVEEGLVVLPFHTTDGATFNSGVSPRRRMSNQG